MPSDFRAGEAGGAVHRVCKGSFVVCFCLFVFVSLRSLLDASESEHGVINEKHEVLESFIISLKCQFV